MTPSHFRNIRQSLTLAVCSALSSAPLIAQENTEIHQNGEMNTASIEQVNPGPVIFGYISQEGDFNAATVYQEGPVEEKMGALITQEGSFNEIATDQRRVETRAVTSHYQIGSHNSLAITQVDGRRLYSLIDQVGDNNTATVKQTVYHAEALATQDGVANTLDINQTGEVVAVTATAVQLGDYNIARITQNGESDASADIQHFGSNNVTEIHQDQGTFIGLSSAMAKSEGGGNRIRVYQSALLGSVEISQAGDFNQIDSRQRGESVHLLMTTQDSNNNITTINQRGIGGRVTIDRTSADGGMSTIYQDFLDSDITITQADTDNMDTDIAQRSGFFSSITVVQTASSDSMALSEQSNVYKANATIRQDATSNSTATILQHSTIDNNADMTADIWQRQGTNLSIAEINQEGTINTAAIEQFGAIDSEARILQTGISATAEIAQMSLGSSAPNTATIIQGGEGYSASIYQQGGGNEATVSQL